VSLVSVKKLPDYAAFDKNVDRKSPTFTPPQSHPVIEARKPLLFIDLCWRRGVEPPRPEGRRILSHTPTRREWIAALDKIESLNPRAVIAGHKRPGNDDSPKIIEETRQYIRDFDRVAETTTTARGLYDKMLELYPDRVNPGERSGFRHARPNRSTSIQKIASPMSA